MHIYVIHSVIFVIFLSKVTIYFNIYKFEILYYNFHIGKYQNNQRKEPFNMMLFNQLIRELHKFPTSKLEIVVYYGLGDSVKLNNIKYIDEFLRTHDVDRLRILCKYSGKSHIVSKLTFKDYRLGIASLDIFHKDGSRIRMEF